MRHQGEIAMWSLHRKEWATQAKHSSPQVSKRHDEKTAPLHTPPAQSIYHIDDSLMLGQLLPPVPFKRQAHTRQLEVSTVT